MAASAGKDILLKINTTGSTYVALAGLRTKTLRINSELVDITNSDSVGMWRELLDGVGVMSMQVQGSGVFLDDAAVGQAVTLCLSKTLRLFQMVVPGLGTFAGSFKISSVEFAGAHNGEETFAVTLDSSGEIAFTAS